VKTPEQHYHPNRSFILSGCDTMMATGVAKSEHAVAKRTAVVPSKQEKGACISAPAL
jgi:uncharacterized protein YceK